jgi:phage shock protein PspC (stress-responsive transcriptional regulator)
VILKRSHDRILGGVCGGIAETLGWPPNQVRLVYALISLLSMGFPGTLVYLVLWITMPPPDPKTK